ncbi:unnamed protein product [Miscanthus lutarioriparius]|uniref:Uncharacterized protein n=1 Tax=Miscanthus lutarioriparius TaxID=422564 RepID=A0A811PBB3_9POAL|nr:unnamed protein product [Miscanthus lutarioriparius]
MPHGPDSTVPHTERKKRRCFLLNRRPTTKSSSGARPPLPCYASGTAWVLTFNPERVKEFLLRTKQLEVPPTSRMFRHAVAAVANNPKEKVAAKLEFFNRTLGCSESEVSTAVSKIPAILGLSDEILLRKIEFLVNEAAMEPQYIVERPVLLALSLEKRLVARHYVMKVLREKGLLDGRTGFYTFAKLGEGAFKLRFLALQMLMLQLVLADGGTAIYAHWQMRPCDGS